MLALDLFCGEGGVCEGLQRAGFEVVGVDKRKACGKYYPGHFIYGNALSPSVDIRDFDFVWASPPCQAFSDSTQPEDRVKHENLIPATRNLIKEHPVTCIENVVGAPIREDLVLIGPMVGLNYLERERRFELSFQAHQPPMRRTNREDWKSGKCFSVMKGLQLAIRERKYRNLHGIPKPTKEQAMSNMGITIDMTLGGIGEAIPPAMAEYIGREAIAFMQGKRMYQQKLAM